MINGKRLLSAFLLLTLLGLAWFFVQGNPSDAEPKTTQPPLGSYAPPQPINYSHKLHAGDLGIECKFCHTYARRSPSAGIPAVEQCMSCHQLIATQKEDIQTLAKAYDEKKPIEWVKIHDLPDFVYFSHKPHIRAGFECQECHGPVEEMEVMFRQAPLTMGWCVNCHQDNLDKGASLDCWTCHK